MCIATWAKSKQEDPDLDLSFVGVNTSGKFAQRHLVRKFIAFRNKKFLLHAPPLIGTNHTCGICIAIGGAFAGVVILGDGTGQRQELGEGLG